MPDTPDQGQGPTIARVLEAIELQLESRRNAIRWIRAASAGMPWPLSAIGRHIAKVHERRLNEQRLTFLRLRREARRHGALRLDSRAERHRQALIAATEKLNGRL